AMPRTTRTSISTLRRSGVSVSRRTSSIAPIPPRHRPLDPVRAWSPDCCCTGRRTAAARRGTERDYGGGSCPRPAGGARGRGYGQLLGTVQLLAEFVLVPFDQASESEFQQLLGQRLRIGTQDLKIAAVALAHRLTLVTRNQKEFSRVPTLGLQDWSV